MVVVVAAAVVVGNQATRSNDNQFNWSSRNDDCFGNFNASTSFQSLAMAASSSLLFALLVYSKPKLAVESTSRVLGRVPSSLAKR